MQTDARRRPKKNNSYLPILLLVLMAVALLLLALLQLRQSKKPISNTEPIPLLVTDTPISHIEVKLDNGVEYVLESVDGKLYLVRGEQQLLVAEDTAKRIMENLSKVYVQNKIADQSIPSIGMRLNPAHIQIQADFADGRQVHYYVGAQVPLVYDYYFVISEAQGIYSIDEGFEDLFFVQPDTLIAVAELDVHRNLIKNILFEGSKRFRLHVRSVERERIYGELEAEISYPADAEYLYQLISGIDDIRLGVYVEPYDASKDYGFEGKRGFRITVDQYAGANESKSVSAGKKTLTFGKDADAFTVYVLYEGYVYRISKIGLASLLEADEQNLASRYPFALSLLDLSNLLSIEDQYQEVTTRWRVDTLVKENEETELRIYKNGADYDLDAFKAMLSQLLQERYDAYIGRVETPTAPPERSIQIKMRSGDYRVDFFHADRFHDYISVNGVILSKWAKQKTASLFSLEREQ